MLKLKGITKIYEVSDLKVQALKGVDLCFRKNEFVSILGPSGCGKTTMLNIVGGLDRYTEGDLVINGKSTKEYSDADWDTYRNHSIGFVFQSYNLIPHQTVLENVELALTLSGVSREERKHRATEVLKRVGLGDKLKNKPSQLSGGQMQRVAIARALVNDPEIILADEPTGALDTETSVQIMDVLKEIANDRLIIMVTHNPELAEKYSTRIVNLLDGEVTGDSNPYSDEEEAVEVENTKQEIENKNAESGLTEKELKKKDKKRKMSFWTALTLSFKNLLTKKARTILVSIAGSIGIIGIALILAVSSGFSTYINKMQEDTLSSYPITIQSRSVDFSSLIKAMFLDDSESKNSRHELDGVYNKDSISSVMSGVGNNLNANNLNAFYKYINDNYDEIKDYVNAVQCTYDLNLSFYLDNEINAPQDINNVQPDSNAIYKMIAMYAINFFENKSNVDVNEVEGGGFGIYIKGSDNLPNYEFMAQYSDLDAIRNALVGIQTGGDLSQYVPVTQEQVVGLAFKIIGLGESMRTGVAGMLFNMNIFNEMIDNDTFIQSQYDVVAGKFPTEANEALLVMDRNNEIDEYILYALGLISDDQMDSILYNLVNGNDSANKIDYNEILGTKYKALEECDFWVNDPTDGWIDFRDYSKEKINNVENEKYNPTKYGTYYATHYVNKIQNCPDENCVKIVGIVRLNDTSDSGSLKTGIAYKKGFTQSMINYHNASSVVGASSLTSIDEATPATISIYVSSFDSKEVIAKFIEKYNDQADSKDKITYTDYVGLMMTTISTIINAITYVLVAFVSVSLIVSSIMIGIITYISVIERTKEIGVLRSVGASKKDVKRVFTAESFIIGLLSGTIGIAISLLLTLPINLVLRHFTGISGLAKLPFVGSVTLIAISIILTLIAGLIPAKAAAKKDPVIALREN